MRDKRLPIGAQAWVQFGPPGNYAIVTIMLHGRDSAGVYTEVRYEATGGRGRLHRSMLFTQRPSVKDDLKHLHHCTLRACLRCADIQHQIDVAEALEEENGTPPGLSVGTSEDF